MIHDIHPTVSGGTLGAINGAFGEARVCDVVRGFEEVSEFIEDVIDRGRGAGVEEGDEAGVVADQFGEGWPSGEAERGGGRRVGVLLEVAGCVCCVEQTDVDVVAVHEEEGDDFVRVGVEPCFDVGQIVGEGAGIFFHAGGVAEIQAPGAISVGLGLQKTDSGVQLRCDIHILVVCGHGANKGGVMGADLGYV